MSTDTTTYNADQRIEALGAALSVILLDRNLSSNLFMLDRMAFAQAERAVLDHGTPAQHDALYGRPIDDIQTTDTELALDYATKAPLTRRAQITYMAQHQEAVFRSRADRARNPLTALVLRAKAATLLELQQKLADTGPRGKSEYLAYQAAQANLELARRINGS